MTELWTEKSFWAQILQAFYIWSTASDFLLVTEIKNWAPLLSLLRGSLYFTHGLVFCLKIVLEEWVNQFLRDEKESEILSVKFSNYLFTQLYKCTYVLCYMTKYLRVQYMFSSEGSLRNHITYADIFVPFINRMFYFRIKALVHFYCLKEISNSYCWFSKYSCIKQCARFNQRQ